MKLSSHNTEQAARGYMMYQLAKRGYTVQFTDSRFPLEDLLVLSPSGKHFGIDVKGMRGRGSWIYKECEPNLERFYAFTYVPDAEIPKVFIMDSETAQRLLKENRRKVLAKNPDSTDPLRGMNWTEVYTYEDRYDLLPK